MSSIQMSGIQMAVQFSNVIQIPDFGSITQTMACITSPFVDRAHVHDLNTILAVIHMYYLWTLLSVLFDESADHFKYHWKLF